MNTKKFLDEFIQNSKNCNTLDECIEFVDKFSFDGNSIKPLQIKNEIKLLLEILSELKPKTVLEIGSAYGGTLFLFSRITSSDGIIISIDLPEGPFGGSPIWTTKLFRSFAMKNQKIHVLREDSHKETTLEQVKSILGDRKIDFLFIDGDHNYHGVKKDFEMYSPFVSDDGLIAFHDINNGPEENVGEVPKFWDEVKQGKKNIEITLDNKKSGYGLGLLIKKNYHDILKLTAKLQNKILRENEIITEENQRKLKQNKIDIENLNSFNKERDLYIKDLEKTILIKNDELSTLEEYATKLQSDLKSKDDEISTSKEYTTKLENEINQKINEINSLIELIHEKEEIENLRNSEQKYYTSRL